MAKGLKCCWMAKTNSVRVYSISRVSSSMQTIQLFEVKAIFGLESTIPEGWLAKWPSLATRACTFRLKMYLNSNAQKLQKRALRGNSPQNCPGASSQVPGKEWLPPAGQDFATFSNFSSAPHFHIKSWIHPCWFAGWPDESAKSTTIYTVSSGLGLSSAITGPINFNWY